MFWSKQDSKNLQIIADSLRTLVEVEAFNDNLLGEELVEGLDSKVPRKLLKKLLKKEMPIVSGSLDLRGEAIKENQARANDILTRLSNSNSFYPEDSLENEEEAILEELSMPELIGG